MGGETAIRDLERRSEIPAAAPKPLTERILSGLPGPRLLWVIVWALVPWLNAAVTVSLQVAGRLPMWPNPQVQLLSRASFSFAVLLSVWGAARITSRLESLRPKLASLVERGDEDPAEVFRRIDSTFAPLLLTLASVAIFATQAFVWHDWLRATIAGASWFVIGIPLWTAFWTYVKLQVGLDRLGRRHLTLEPYPEDRSLGLRPVGSLAFTGFSMLFGAVAPLVLTGFSDPIGVTLGIAVLVACVGLFFLSLSRLHRQMVAAKQQQLAWARKLYTQAYDPVRAEGTLEALQRQAGLLSAAEALERRAERIQEWPFDEGTFARVVTIASSVTGAIIGRLILDPIGL